MTEITEPGVYDLTSTEYHADPVPGGSLSSTGARKLLPPSCPAKFAYERDNPPASTKPLDLGSAAHDAVLGAGPEIVVVDADSWRTNKAKDAAAEARARGAVPILTHEAQQIAAMRDALLAHPFAGRLFQPGSGTPEASLFWRDEPTGTMLRARLDWLRRQGDGRVIIPDLKTAVSAEPDEFMKAAARYGYHQQGAWYKAGAVVLGLADPDAVFVFVVQEKEPPYVVSVIQADAAAMRIGAAMNRRAIDIYAACTERGDWPGYVEDVALGSLPRWYELTHEEDAA